MKPLRGLSMIAYMHQPKPHAENLRLGRNSQPGCSYFLTTSVVNRRNIFDDHKHATILLNAIRWLHNADRFKVDAAVVMPDHLHLVGLLGERTKREAVPTLASVMHTLKSYSANCLALAGVSMPVWQKGFHDHGLRDNEDYRRKVQYVMHNPVRAGLVQQPEDFPNIILPEWWPEN